MKDFPNSRCPVDSRRLVQLRADARQRCQIDDSGISRLLPDTGPYIDGWKCSRSTQHIVGVAHSEQMGELAEQARAGIQNNLQDADHDDRGNKIRRIGDELHGFFEPNMLHFVQRDRKDDCAWYADAKAV